MKKLLEKYADMLSYLFFGVLTTAVNYLVYLPCLNYLGSAGVSNVLAWAAAVAFAFVTNKRFVFKSYDWSIRVIWPELTKFLGCRVASGVMETGFLVLTVDCLGWNGIWMKLVAAVVVIILNYIGSKFFVFIKNK